MYIMTNPFDLPPIRLVPYQSVKNMSHNNLDKISKIKTINILLKYKNSS